MLKPSEKDPTASLRVIRDDLGFGALLDPIAKAGLTHAEIELLERWWIPDGAFGHRHDVRRLLFEAADVLAPAFVKIGSENGPPTSDPAALAAPLH